MDSKKDILYFCNAAVLYGYKNIGIFDEFNQARKCIFNNFLETISISEVLLTYSIIDVVFLKNCEIDIGNVIENIHDLRAIIL